ncbi:ferritin family protein [Thermodesulfobacteriota bacterium]
MFSFNEILDLAIQIEENGKKFFHDASKKVTDPSLVSILKWVEEEEKEHIKWFSQLKQTAEQTTSNPQLEKMGRAILQGLVLDQTFSLQDIDFSKIEHVDALLKLVVEFEKDTVYFYEMLGSFVEDTEMLNILDMIIEQENRHIKVLREFMDGKEQEL